MLVVQHEDACPPALFGRWLEEAGVVLDVRRPYAGDPLPRHLDEHDGLLVLGGEMGAYDDGAHGWLTTTKMLLSGAARTGSPTLGICLGHQLTAVALGGRVQRNPAGQATGITAVGWTAEADNDPLFAEVAGDVRAVQWNNDAVTTLPSRARPLAWAADGTPQAVRFGEHAWGVQFHPEVDADVFGLWVARGRDRAADRGLDADAALRAVERARAELHRAWRPLAHAYARVVVTAPR